MLDKIQGGLFGVAIGDALGATTEFMSKEEIIEEYGKVTEIIGGGVWKLKRGETTDDTAMTLAIVKGIMANSDKPIEEMGKQFRHWENTDPIDIGISTRATLENYEGDWFHAAEKAHHQQGGLSAGNGTLMRCLPIALAYPELQKIDELSELQSKMTHYDDLASEACVIYNRIAKRLLENENLHTAIHSEIKNTRYESNYVQEPNCPPDGFVVHSMKWVLYWLLNSDTFEDVVVGATNMGRDSDTIAAIAGGLKGIDVGFKQLPSKYTDKIIIKKHLLDYAEILNEIRGQNTNVLRGQANNYISQLKVQANQLYEWAKIKPMPDESKEVLESIRKNIYLFRLSFNEDHDDFEHKFQTWWQAKMRYRRSLRLIQLDAPPIITQHELNWLQIMIDHMDKRLNGIEPQFTKNQLESLIEIEKPFEADGN
ncbi:ADP-ribosylglycohydrolase family protein [Lysinibacillus sp. LZ02]|uniref:ADP-ribosylglycohydrolase family protein n=1 Tax=Lysinibacillus sp. LZ02 TaxID=3420668 RepID=UPI003D36BA99